MTLDNNPFLRIRVLVKMLLFLYRYAKDIILTVVITQSASLLHRYFWWIFLVVCIKILFTSSKL
jgi:hypothetical protein